MLITCGVSLAFALGGCSKTPEAQAPEHFPKPIEVVEDAAGPSGDEGAVGGEGGAASGAVEEAQPEPALQPGQPLAGRGLADAELGGRGGEAALVGDVHEQLERFHVRGLCHAPRL